LGVEKNLFNNELFNQLEKLKPLYFNETNPTKKQAYKKQIDKLISEITSGHTEFDFEVYFSEVFHEKGGFDIVIANPPYVEFKNLDKAEKDKLESIYTTTKGKYDLYIPFLEKSQSIAGASSVIIYICSTRFLHRDYGKNIRSFIKTYYVINEIID